MKSYSVELILDPKTQLVTVQDESPTVSVLWDQAVQQAVINTAVGPTVASRAYSMVHTAMFDAWAAYDPTAIATQLGDDLQRPEAENTDANKTEAMSYSAYRVLTDLFPDQVEIFDQLMADLGFDPSNITTDTTTAAGIGNVSAEALLEFRHQDGSNQLNNYADTTGYQPVNSPDELVYIGLWTPENVPIVELNALMQVFLTAQWGEVTPFGLDSGDQLRPVAPEPFLLVEADVDFEARTITLEDGSVIEISRDLVGTVINPEFIAQAEQVVEISANLTDEQKLIAEFWEDGGSTSFPPGTWMTFGQCTSSQNDYVFDDFPPGLFAISFPVLKLLKTSRRILRLYQLVLKKSSILNDIHYVYNYLRGLKAALDYNNQSLCLTQQGGDQTREATRLNNISRAYIYLALKDSVQSFEYHRQQFHLLKQVRYKVEEAFILSNIERTLTNHTEIINNFLPKVKHNIIIGRDYDYMAIFALRDFYCGKNQIFFVCKSAIGKSSFYPSLYNTYKNKQYKVEKMSLIRLCFSKRQESNELFIKLGQQSVLKLLIETFTERLQSLGSTHGSKLIKQLAKVKFISGIVEPGIVTPEPEHNQVKEKISVILFDYIKHYIKKTKKIVKYKGYNRQVKLSRLRSKQIQVEGKSMCLNLSEQSKLISRETKPTQGYSSSVKMKEQNGQDLLREGLNTTNKHKIDYKKILEEYYNLSISAELSELDFERMDNILKMAESDKVLSILINEIDYKVGQSIITIEKEYDDFYDKKQARLVEFLNV